MKTKSISQVWKILALLLVITLICPVLFATLSIQALSADNVPALANTSNNVLNSVSTKTDISLLSLDDIPNFVPKKQFYESGHILRLTDEETGNTLVYLNADGSKTTYITDFPIKYTDTATGRTHLIDLSLVEKSDHYTTSANSIVLSASKNAMNGISLSYGNNSITLTPLLETSSKTESNTPIAMIPPTVATSEVVTYKNIFDIGIDLRYTPTYNGVKEDIILESYTGKNAFSFLLNTNGQSIYNGESGVYIAQSEHSKEKVLFGKVVAFDASFKASEGHITIKTINPGQLYQITISVAESFLKDPATKYPVCIDPTLTISNDAQGIDAIIDAPVYSGLPTQNFGSYVYNCTGYVDDIFGTGRTAVKLNGLTNWSVYPSLSADAIESVKFYVKDSSGDISKSINIFPLINIDSWNENDITWNDTVNNIALALHATATVGSSEWSFFDITSLVKAWKNGAYMADCGFIMRSALESENSNFYSTESVSSNQPYIVITYLDGGSGGGTNFTNAETLYFGEVASIHTVITGERRYFKFIPVTSGEYFFYSVHNSGDPKIWLYDSSQALININDDGGGQPDFRLTATLSKGCTYYIELGHYGTKTGSYDLHILCDSKISNGTYLLQNIETAYYMDIHGPVEQEVLHQWQYHAGDQVKWAFNRDTNGYYTIQSLYGDEKYVAISSTNTEEDNIVLISNITNYAQWKIYTDGHAHFYLEPKMAPGKTLYAPNYVEGEELQLALISNYDNLTFWDIQNIDFSEPHEHFYEQSPGSLNFPPHPHEVIYQCECGATQITYAITPSCSVCMADGKVVVNSKTSEIVLADLVAEETFLVPTTYPTEVYIEYTNYYLCPNSIITNYPKFGTYFSSVISDATPAPGSPTIYRISSAEVQYFAFDESELFVQPMSLDMYCNTYSTPPGKVYTFNVRPSHTTAGAAFSISTIPQYQNIYITTDFQYNN